MWKSDTSRWGAGRARIYSFQYVSMCRTVDVEVGLYKQ